ncbi:MAG: GNAT family N-acetyltransferase [Bradyrhizobiaceae bacterium]|nr:GNAT family N-acetyltransferase [Bradyrhizobiaceae bacterium]
MPGVVIRKMHEDDRPRVMELLSFWNMAPRAASPEIPDPERSSLIVEHTFIAIADGTLVGVASYILHGNGFAETASLAVDKAWLGTKVGERLQTIRLIEMQTRGVVRVRTEADRPEVIDWYIRKFGYRIAGTARKKHDFGLSSVDHWTVLELNLTAWHPASSHSNDMSSVVGPGSFPTS